MFFFGARTVARFEQASMFEENQAQRVFSLLPHNLCIAGICRLRLPDDSGFFKISVSNL